MKWWEGKKTWPFISSHAAHAKLDGANGKIRRRWRQIRRIWMDFDAYLRRNGTLMHIQRDLWPHTLTQHWPLTSCILRPTHYIFMIMQIRPHPSLLFITLMNIHDDSATSLLRDVTSLKGCDVMTSWRHDVMTSLKTRMLSHCIFFYESVSHPRSLCRRVMTSSVTFDPLPHLNSPLICPSSFTFDRSFWPPHLIPRSTLM